MGLFRDIPWIRIVLCTTLVAAQGCGGSGGGDGESSADNQAPTAAFTASPQTGTAPLAVGFDASASSDTDGTIASYGWDFGDGATGTGETVSHTYTAAGTYTATLNVADDDGATADVQQSVVVSPELGNQPPTPVFTATPDTGQAPLQVSFDGSASSDSDGTIVEYRWDFGDGSVTVTGQAVDHIFASAGTFPVRLTATDDAGDSEVARASIVVTEPPNQRPSAAFSNDPISGSAPLTVQFDASASSDPDGSVTSYAWDFGDGATGTGQTSSHTYTGAGTYTVALTVTDNRGATHTTQHALTVTGNSSDGVAPVVSLTAPTALAELSGEVSLSATATDDTGVARVEFWVDGARHVTDSTDPYQATLDTTAYGDGLHAVSAIAYDAGGNSDTAAVTVTFANGTVVIPPAPEDAASQLPTTQSTPLADATAFLYSGTDPVQTGVPPDTIESRRVAVLRGRVLDRDDSPLSGVTVTVLGHPEFGQTVSRTDGMFDLVVNGGGALTANYRKAGYLPVQRQIDSPWQDYIWAPDVTMVAKDLLVTTVDLASAEPMQAAQSSVVTDDDGSRQATVLIPQGTQAQVILEDGSLQTVDTLNISLTEYTVGNSGPETMPGELPPTSAYTYAFEISANEAVAKVAGKDVVFNQAVPIYVDNFIGFPVGITVPVGYYDNDRGVWVPSESGRVIEVLGTTAGLADLDVDGDGVTDVGSPLVDLGITDAERLKLADLFTSGETLWRFEVDHFSTWDANWGWRPPDNATFPETPERKRDPRDPCERGGSIIECQSQVLGESIDISGTPFHLHYRSDRVPGRKTAYTMEIPLSGSTVPGTLLRIDLELEVAGRKFEHTVGASNEATCTSQGARAWCTEWQPITTEPLEDQIYTFTWDGKDAYGRILQGKQLLSGRIGYTYVGGSGAGYQDTQRFGYNGDGMITAGGFLRGEITLWQEWQELIGVWGSTAEGFGFGGWSLSEHHVYDPIGNTLHKGDGNSVSSNTLASAIRTVAGNGVESYAGDDGPATQASMRGPRELAVSASGTVYIADGGNNAIRRVERDGTITTIAGTGNPGFSGDGGPATQAQLHFPTGIAVAPDNSVYFADNLNHRVRRVGPDGTISTVAGIGTAGFGGDGGLATLAALNAPQGVAMGADGSLYIVDRGNHLIRRVAPDGSIHTVAGNRSAGYSGDDGAATQASLNFPWAVDVGPDGSLYIADVANQRIRRVGPGGIITTVAGDGVARYWGDGGPAVLASLNAPYGVAVDADGSLYIADRGNHRVRRISRSGIINTLAGTGTAGYSGDQGPASLAELHYPGGIVLAPDGVLYVADRANNRVRAIARPLPAASRDEILIPSAAGSELYVFDEAGRHLRTIHALTGQILYQFSYNPDGFLVAVEDDGGNATTITRDVNGAPVAIVAPNGQRTNLVVDVNGYLSSISNPANETTSLTYSADGLLTSLTNPRGGIYTFTYDALGRLIKDEDPALGFQSLFRTESSTGYQVDLTSTLGRTTTYGVDTLDSGEERLSVEFPDGTANERLGHTDGSVTLSVADGTEITVLQGADPRWGMLAPIADSVTISTPGGLSSTTTRSRNVSLATEDLLSLVSQSDEQVVNGQTFTRIYDAATLTYTDTTPEGRQITTAVDTQGRTTEVLVPGLYPVQYGYDVRGRLTTVAVGDGAGLRTTTVAYDTSGNLSGITDPLSRQWSFEYDLAGRLVAEHLPGSRTIGYGYDVDGNVTSLTPPGLPAHTASYTAAGLASEYVPPHPDPADTTSDPRSTFTHDLDGQLTRLTRPDGRLVDLGYDSAGRLAQVSIAEGTYTIAYDAASGRVNRVTAADNSTLSFTYDGALPTGEEWAGGLVTGSVGYTYDNGFRVASVLVNGATLAAHSYDADGLLIQAGAMSLTRDAQHGLFTGSSLGSVTDNVTYDGFGEVASYQAAYQAAVFFTVQYLRDATGRITSRTESHSGQTTTFGYAYDAAGRLASVAENGTTTVEYQYDANGNRTSRVASGQPAETGVCDDQDRLTRYGGVTLAYTAHGERLTRTEGALTTRYDYDALGNLRAVTLSDGTRIDYLIDGNGRRIGKQVDGALVQGLLYADEINPIAELDGTGAVVARFVYGSRPSTPDYMEKGGSTYRIVSDHLGSPRFVVDVATGTVAQQLEYDEFGVVVTDTNPGFQPFGFAGGLYDSDTGLTRFGVRDYDAATGRWAAKDPIGFAGEDTNLYAYVENDPVNWIDPHGLGRWYSYFDWLDPVGNAVAGFGDVVSFGLTKRIRQSANIDAMVDPCSGAYFGGKVAGVVHGLLSRGIALSNWARAAKLSRTLAAREIVRSRHAVYKAWEAARQAARSKAIRDGLASAAKAARSQGLPSAASITSLGAKTSGALPSPASLVTPSLGGLRVTFAP